MKNLLAALLITSFFVSCNKESQTSIVGIWKPVARYNETQPGIFEWIDLSNSRWLSIMTLTQDGRYSFFSDISEGHGNFEYNVAKRELIFLDPAQGQRQVRIVSHLDIQNLVTEYYYNGVLKVKYKYIRLK